MRALESERLQRFLEAELAGGNRITTGGPVEWGSLRYFVMLREPFKTRAWERDEALVFREINDPHYWKAEVEDAIAGEVVACGFAIDQVSCIRPEPG